MMEATPRPVMKPDALGEKANDFFPGPFARTKLHQGVVVALVSLEY